MRVPERQSCTTATNVLVRLHWRMEIVQYVVLAYSCVDFGGLAARPEPSSAALPGPITLPMTALARIVLDGAGARTLIS